MLPQLHVHLQDLLNYTSLLLSQASQSLVFILLFEAFALLIKVRPLFWLFVWIASFYYHSKYFTFKSFRPVNVFILHEQKNQVSLRHLQILDLLQNLIRSFLWTLGSIFRVEDSSFWLWMCLRECLILLLLLRIFDIRVDQWTSL